MRRIGSAFTTAIVIVVGVITLLGLLVGDGLGNLSLLVQATGIGTMTTVFLQLATITIAVTVLIGIINLLSVHGQRILRPTDGRAMTRVYSLIVVVSALAVIVLGTLERSGVLTGEPPVTMILLEGVQVSIESALAGLVLFALVYGAYRLMRKRVTGSALLFTVVLLVLLVGALPFSSPVIRLIGSIRDWLLAVPVSAGARGILLGIALAAAVAGVRVLIGQDRSYRE